MDVKSNIPFSELAETVKHLPAGKKSVPGIKKSVKNQKRSKPSLPDLLLSGPTMSKDQYTAYQNSRKQMNKWRAA